jgi:hypothetical protein
VSAFADYVERCGVEFDTAVNVLTGGQLGQTVSYRAAVAARDGSRVGCALCWVLNWAVQRNHCALQFTNTPSTAVTYVRGGIAFGVGILSAAGLVHMGVDIVRHFL